jgi:hypothetical protein
MGSSVGLVARNARRPSCLGISQQNCSGSDFQLSLDIGHGLTSATYTRAAVNQHWLLQPMISLPDVLQLLTVKRWMLVVADWNVLGVESAPDSKTPNQS